MHLRSRMRPDAFQRLQVVFDAALQQPAAARAAFVTNMCACQPGLADEVMALLAHADAAEATTLKPFAGIADTFDAIGRESMAGRTIGHFRLATEIASGGMGRVFLAHRVDGDVDQRVALKLIRRELFDASLLRRFSAERRILGSLNHPGIAHLIDAGTDDGVPFVAMEYVDGLPLLAHCARHALPLRARLVLFRDILAAVSHAHQRLVVHRDLKPDNVLVTSDGRPKLLDFGIARALDPEAPLTATVDRFLTPAYAAPERLLGQDAGVAGDVYSLGALLYELLAGAPPFDLRGCSAGEAEQQILNVPPPTMRATAARHAGRQTRELDGDLEHIVQNALRKEPEARYASVDRFDEDLARYLDRRPVLAAGSGMGYRLRKFCARNALAVSFTLVFLVAGVVVFAQTLRQNAAIRAERDRAQATLAILHDAFRYADPTRLQAGDTRARTILASAAREVGALETSQPVLFRELAYQIGEIQLNLGLNSAGLDLIRRANRVRSHVPASGRVLEVRGLILAGHMAEAHAAIGAGRETLRDVPAFLAEEGHLLYLQERHAEAIALLERSLALSASMDAPALRDRTYLYLAEAHRRHGHHDRAARVLERLIQAQSRRDGDMHPNVLVTRLRWIELLPRTGPDGAARAERALVTIEPALDRYFDPGSAIQGEYHNLFGRLLSDQMRHEDALRHFRQALSADEIALGPLHENTLRAHLNVAIQIAYGMRDRSPAHPHFATAIDGIERSLGPASSLAGFARLEAAKARFWDQDIAAARHLLAPAHAVSFFPAMTPVNRDEYLAALHYGFGPVDCATRGRSRNDLSHDAAVARVLICRHDPQGQRRPAP